MYDYVVIGAGIVGVCVARMLSKYDIKVLVVDKENDIANGTTMANSAIIHAGYDPEPGSLKAKLNVRGNKLYHELSKEYDIPFNQCGSLTVAIDQEGIDKIKELYNRGLSNGVEVYMIEQDVLFKMEPSLNPNVKLGLFAPTAGIIYPWQISLAMMDHSITNGVELSLNTQVLNIEREDHYYYLKTNKQDIKTKNLINCSGVYGVQVQEMIEESKIKITPVKGEYYVLSRDAYKYINHIIFPVPTSKGKGVLATPISQREILIGPSSTPINDFDDTATSQDGLSYIKNEIHKTMQNILFERVIRSFSGLRATPSNKDFNILFSKNNPGVIHIIGIDSPGFASAPAIAEYLETQEQFRHLELKKDYQSYQATTRIRPLYQKERNEAIKKDPRYGHIICRCETISNKEIIDSIHGNVGARSVKGVKKRVRPGQGPCQGGFCEVEIVKILAKELNIPLEDVVNDRIGSNIIIKKCKE